MTAARQCSKISLCLQVVVVTEDLGIKLENVQLSDLGKAKRVNVDKENTVIVEGGGKSSDIQGRVKLIRNQIASIQLLLTMIVRSSKSVLRSLLVVLLSSMLVHKLSQK